MSTRASKRTQRGFTLIEVLVALAIAGLGLMAAFEATGTGLNSVQVAAQTVAGVRHAQAHLADVGIEVPLTPGEVRGSEGDGYRWRIRVTSVDRYAGETKDAPGRALYSVESVVTWTVAGRERSVSLRSFRTGKPAANPE